MENWRRSYKIIIKQYKLGEKLRTIYKIYKRKKIKNYVKISAKPVKDKHIT